VSAASVAERWVGTAVGHGPGAATADRDLDAVLALFDAASRFVDRLPSAGPEVFLDHVADQQFPADTLAPSAPTRDTVALLTAHAAKGLEWDLVVVAGVTEGVWPDLRVRDSVLGASELTHRLSGLHETPGAILSALAGRRTPAVLRRGHPRPAAAARHRDRGRGEHPRPDDRPIGHTAHRRAAPASAQR